MRKFVLSAAVVLAAGVPARAQADFRVPPYIQNPAYDGITVMWLSNADQPGEVVVGNAAGPIDSAFSTPVQAPELEYPSWEISQEGFPDSLILDPPYRHSVRFGGLEWNSEYWYRVTQGSTTFQSTFRTARGIHKSIRFMVYGDSETEPNPTPQNAYAVWSDPADASSDRRYLLDQIEGYAHNLEVMRARDPDFIAIAGDLVQSGGEQRDWDEFWRQLTAPDSARSLADRTTVITVPGNHEYFSSPHSFSNDTPKRYRQPWSEMAMSKYSAYFDVPDNGSVDARGRYFRFDYGPVSLIALDVCNNGVNPNPDDTNLELLGEDDPDGGKAPSFGPGSAQYEWLEQQLADARLSRPFVFVLLHYAPYSVGPHGWPAGGGDGEDPLSGVPVRQLTPLFMQYGVDAVFAGHDEMWERSVVDGTETLPDGSTRPHTIQFYDLGTGGDDLRGPQDGLDNPLQAFLVHTDVPEQWDGETLIDGGKHYGHLEVDVHETEPNKFEAVLTPVYAFPVFAGGSYVRTERRVYNDVITLTSDDDLPVLGTDREVPTAQNLRLGPAYPNPMVGSTTVEVELPAPADVNLSVYDALGRRVTTLASGIKPAGRYSYRWNGEEGAEQPVPAGVYFIRLESDLGNQTAAVVRSK